MELLIQREPSQDEATYGKLSVNGQYHCETLEDEIREVKVPNATAIPAGRYRVTIDVSMRFKRLMPHVLDVPGFTGVRIHSGNTAAQTDGCPLVGKERINFGRDWRPVPGVAFSAIAFNPLFDLMKAAFAHGEEIWLEVRNP